MTETTGITCNGCGAALEDVPNTPTGWPPCTKCGSTSRNFNRLVVALPVHAEAMVYSLQSSKRYREGPGGKKKRLRREFKIGDALYKRDGRWYFMEQIVDHENDLYWKRIIDRLTGRLVLFRYQPLSQHHGFGSAKNHK